MSSLYKQIWDELSVINVNDHVEKKMNLSYLSWSWAYSTLMKYYPHNSYSFNTTVEGDSSVTVECVLTIHQGNEVAIRTMWLPVMDHKNQAIQNPTARHISDAKMRCLVKCIGMFGLGHYLYAGEDLPEGTKPVGNAKPLTGKAKLQWQDYFIAMHENWVNADGLGLLQLDQEMQEDDVVEGVYDAVYRAFTTEQKNTIKMLISGANK